MSYTLAHDDTCRPTVCLGVELSEWNKLMVPFLRFSEAAVGAEVAAPSKAQSLAKLGGCNGARCLEPALVVQSAWRAYAPHKQAVTTKTNQLAKSHTVSAKMMALWKELVAAIPTLLSFPHVPIAVLLLGGLRGHAA